MEKREVVVRSGGFYVSVTRCRSFPGGWRFLGQEVGAEAWDVHWGIERGLLELGSNNNASAHTVLRDRWTVSLIRKVAVVREAFVSDQH